MDDSTDGSTRSFPVSGRKLPEPLSGTEINRRLLLAINAAMGDRRFLAKRLAVAADTNVRSMENNLAERNGMSLASFVNLIRRVPELKPWAAQLLDMDARLDPLLERKLIEAAQLLSRRMDR